MIIESVVLLRDVPCIVLVETEPMKILKWKFPSADLWYPPDVLPTKRISSWEQELRHMIQN